MAKRLEDSAAELKLDLLIFSRLALHKLVPIIVDNEHLLLYT